MRNKAAILFGALAMIVALLFCGSATSGESTDSAKQGENPPVLSDGSANGARDGKSTAPNPAVSAESQAMNGENSERDKSGGDAPGWTEYTGQRRVRIEITRPNGIKESAELHSRGGQASQPREASAQESKPPKGYVYQDGGLVPQTTTHDERARQAEAQAEPPGRFHINTPLNWLFKNDLPPPQEWFSPRPSSDSTDWTYGKGTTSPPVWSPEYGQPDSVRKARRPPWYLEFSVDLR